MNVIEFHLFSIERKHDFGKYYHKANNETYYGLNRKQLGEYWHGVIEDQKMFCSEKCNECEVCKVLNEVFENLQDAYFFAPIRMNINIFCGKSYLKELIILKNLEQK